MMFAQAHYPDSLPPRQLDSYLERGWFRMGQHVFTSTFWNFSNTIYSLLWLRVALGELKDDTNKQKLFRRNSSFRVKIDQAVITPEKEELFSKYKRSVSFETASSLSQLLFGTATQSIFNTWEVSVFDGDRLIAVGFFDIGGASAEGINSIYDPEYKKYSLGKYLIHLKIDHCKALRLHYFYPGYFVPGYALFDYKLTIGASSIQYLQMSSQQWLPIDLFSAKSTPLNSMLDKLQDLQQVLARLNVSAEIVYYEFFNANLITELRGADLFDFPVFLYRSGENPDSTAPLVVFDVRDGRYHLLQCFSVYTLNPINSIAGFYSDYLLKVERDLLGADTPEDIAAFMVKGQSDQESF